MSLIQQVTPQLLEVQSILPDRELSSLYRYVAVRSEIDSGECAIEPSVYVLQWRVSPTIGWRDVVWNFCDENNNWLSSKYNKTIRGAIGNAITYSFTVYRISNSSL